MENEKFKGKLFKTGSSLGVIIPKNVVEFCGFKDTDMVEIEIKKVVPIEKPSEVKEDFSDVKEV